MSQIFPFPARQLRIVAMCVVAGWFILGDPVAAGRVGNDLVSPETPQLLVTAIATGVDHTCAVTSAGAVRCWGGNANGELGNGTTTASLAPIGVSGLSSGVSAIAAAGSRTCAIQNGGVVCWGDYTPGFCCPGNPTTGSLVPEPVPGLPSGVARVAVGDDHACIVTNEGAVWCWGANDEGQLGNGTIGATATPTVVSGLSAGGVHVSTGNRHTCALATSGAVLCWGRNSSGQLGDGSQTGSATPVQSGISQGAVHVSAGNTSSCAITNDGSTWCWGDNRFGRLGIGTDTAGESLPVLNGLAGGASVTMGAAHVCATTTSGGAWCWARNDAGQVGDGSTTARLSPIEVVGLSADVVAVDAEGDHTCAVKTDGSAWCWGNNHDAQLGDGTRTNRVTPVQVDFDLLAPAVTQSPVPIMVTEGGTASFSVAGVGHPSPSVQWQMLATGQTSWVNLADTTPFNSSPYTGVTTTTLTVTQASRSLDGNAYRALLMSDLGQAASASALLSVDYELRISAHPVSHSIIAGQAASFSVTATVTGPVTYRWQTMPAGGSVWSDVANDGLYSGADSSMLSVSNATVALNRRRYRVVLTNSVATATSHPASLIVAGPLVATPASLRFAATKAGPDGALVTVTDPQATMIGSHGEATAWTASADQPWLRLSTNSGTGAGVLVVSIVDPDNVLGASTAATGAITVTPTTAGLSPITVAVSVSIAQSTSGTSAPFGRVDTPAQNATGVSGAVGLTGWALDDIGVTSVKVYRNCFAFDQCRNVAGRSVVYVGEAMFVAGARPDVEAAFPGSPQAYRAGWGLQVLSNMLPRVPDGRVGGQGTITFSVFATDEEGNVTPLGRSRGDTTPTTVTLDNDNHARPFGTLDTPAPGATVSGTLANFGWVLTPDANTVADPADIVMPVDGSTMTVYIDGAPAGSVAYNQCRGTVGTPVAEGAYCNDDVASAFGHTTPRATFSSRTSNPTRFRNLDAGRGAIGVFLFNTLTLTNGIHSIAWGVTDSGGRAEGIGSRFFSVLNTGTDSAVAADDAVKAQSRSQAESRGSDASLPADIDDVSRVFGRSGFSLTTPLAEVVADDQGDRFVHIEQSGRLELELGSGVETGYLVANGTLRDLPLGSRLDAVTGRFTWAPSVAHLGRYRLEFLKGGRRLPVTVTVAPTRVRAATDAQVRMRIDTPRLGDTVRGTVRIEGWALDPEAFTSSGIGAIHVWARRLDQPTVGPEFVGVGTLSIARPDVAAAFGPMHHSAGYRLTATLAPGLYEVTVYAWNVRTARWEDARSVRVSVSR